MDTRKKERGNAKNHRKKIRKKEKKEKTRAKKKIKGCLCSSIIVIYSVFPIISYVFICFYLVALYNKVPLVNIS